MIKKIKKLLLIFLFGSTMAFPQVDNDILAEFDLMAKMVSKDIKTAVYNGEMPADIAITSFGVFGFTEGEKKYFEEVMNRVFYSDISFKLISIPESQEIQVEEVDNKLVIKKGASRNSDLKRYADSINSKHYGEVYIYLMEGQIYMKILVHEAETGDVVWSDSWAVKRDDKFTLEVGYLLGYSFSQPSLYHYIHLFFGARAVGLGDFGLSVDLGAYHNLDLLNAAQNPNFDLATDLGPVGGSLLFAPKVSLNVLEMIPASYMGIDFFVIIKPGLRIDITVINGGNDNLRPRFYFAANLGVGVGFGKLNVEVNFDVNPQSGFLLTGGLYAKF